MLPCSADTIPEDLIRRLQRQRLPRWNLICRARSEAESGWKRALCIVIKGVSLLSELFKVNAKLEAGHVSGRFTDHNSCVKVIELESGFGEVRRVAESLLIPLVESPSSKRTSK